MRRRNSALVEREEDYGNSDSVVGESATPFNEVVREREREIGNPNPSSVIDIDSSDSETENLGNGGGERDVSVVESSRRSVVEEDRRERDTPPDDDCCPICFGNFTIACKTNCGHWFCAGCILQFWNYRSELQKCMCPICSQLISKLTPEASLLIRQEEEVIEVLKDVQRYNRLFQGGAYGLMRKVLELPLVFKRVFQGLMDPAQFRFNYYTIRFAALLLSCIYNISPFNFIPTGGMGTRRLFDFIAVAMVLIFFLVGVVQRLILRRRVRLLAAAQAQP